MTPRLRRWLCAGAALVALVAAGLAIALYRLNAYLYDHRDAVAAQASAALGRTVRFGALGVSLRGGLSARVTDLRVADDPRFAAGDCLRADQVFVTLDLLPALLGRYRIRRIVLDSPAITIIRTADGWNADTIGHAFDGSSTTVRAPAPPPAVAPHGGAALASLLIASATMHDGRVELIDRRSDPPTAMRVDRLEVSASDIATDSVMRVDLRAALLGAADHNLFVTGSVDPRSPNPLDLRVALGPLALAALAPLVPALDGRGVSGTVAATLQVAGPLDLNRLPTVSGRIEVRDGGLADLAVPIHAFTGTIEIGADRAELPRTIVQVGDAPIAIACAATPLHTPVLTCTATAERLTSNDLGVRTAEGDVLHAVQLATTLSLGEPLRAELRSERGVVHGVAYRDLQATARLERGAATVERLLFSAFDGSLRGSGSVRGADSATPTFELHATVDGLRLTALLASQGVAEARRVDGRVHADLTLAGSGREWPSIRPTLRGGGRADVTDGVLRDVNLAEQVLNGVGGLTQLLSPRVREHHPGIFTSADTRFAALGASVRIGDGRAVTDDAQLRARDFTVDGRGTVALDGRLDLRGTFTASPELTKDLIGGIKEARGLANRNGQLEVPFTVSGTVADARVRPDRDFVANALPHAIIEQGLSTLLDKANKKGARDTQPKPAAPLLQKELEKLFGH